MGRDLYDDLRGFITEVEALGALRRIEGAAAALEIGGVTEVAAALPECPALLFDTIPGHAKGFRVFTNATVEPATRRARPRHRPGLAATRRAQGMEAPPRQPAAAQARDRRAGAVPGELIERRRGRSRTIPAPLWHRGDGGPFVGSGSIVVMRDPDSGWINASIYRVQLHDRATVTIQFDHAGRHGAIIARKYWAARQALPRRHRQRSRPGALRRRALNICPRAPRNMISPAPSRAGRSRWSLRR